MADFNLIDKEYEKLFGKSVVVAPPKVTQPKEGILKKVARAVLPGFLEKPLLGEAPKAAPKASVFDALDASYQKSFQKAPVTALVTPEVSVVEETPIEGTKLKYNDFQKAALRDRLEVNKQLSAAALELSEASFTERMNPFSNLRTKVKNLQIASDAYEILLSKTRQDQGFFKDLLQGMNDYVTTPFLGDIKSFKEIIDVTSAVNKKEKELPITPYEDSLIKKFQAKELPIKRGIGYSVGATIIQLPSFALEFAATGGVYSLVKGGVIKTTTKVVPKLVAVKLGKIAVGKLATEFTGFTIGAVAQSAVNVPKIAARTAEFMIPNADLVAGTAGDQLVGALDKNGDSFEKALVKGFGTVVVDYWTERTGVVVEKPLGFLMRATLGKWLVKKGIKTTSTALAKIAEKIAWNGIIGEVFEEELAELAQAPIEGRPYKAPILTPEGNERLMVETLAIGAFGGLGKVSNEVLKRFEGKREVIEAPVIERTEEIIEVPPDLLDKKEEELSPRLQLLKQQFEKNLAGQERLLQGPKGRELLLKKLAAEEEKGQQQRLLNQIDAVIASLNVKPEEITPEIQEIIDKGETIKIMAEEAMLENPVQTQREEIIQNTLMSLVLAEAGRRIPIKEPIGPGEVMTEVTGMLAQPSTFPKWIPEDLRHKPLLDKVVDHISNGTVPSKETKEKALYTVVLERINAQLKEKGLPTIKDNLFEKEEIEGELTKEDIEKWFVPEEEVIPTEQSLAQEARKLEKVLSPQEIVSSKARMGYLTEKDNLPEMIRQYGDFPMVVKDVNGQRAIMNASDFVKLSEHKSFRDRVRETWVAMKPIPAHLKYGTPEMTKYLESGRKIASPVEKPQLDKEFMEALQINKLLKEPAKPSLQLGKLVDVGEITLTNNSSITRQGAEKFKTMLTDNKIRQALKDNGIKEVIIEPPYKFSLSEQANISPSKRIIRINADATNPTDTIFHELGHQKFKDAPKEIQEKLIEFAKKTTDPEMQGYKRIEAWEEIIADSLYKKTDFYNQAVKGVEEVGIPQELQPLAQKVKKFDEFMATEKGFGAGISPRGTQAKSRLLEDEIGNWFYDNKIEIPKLESPYSYAKKILESPEEFIARELRPVLEIPQAVKGVKEVKPRAEFVEELSPKMMSDEELLAKMEEARTNLQSPQAETDEEYESEWEDKFDKLAAEAEKRGLVVIPEEELVLAPGEEFEPDTDEEYTKGFEAVGRNEAKFDDTKQVFKSTSSEKKIVDPETRLRISLFKESRNQLGYVINLIRQGKVVPEDLRWLVDNLIEDGRRQTGEDVAEDLGDGKYKFIFNEDTLTEEGLDMLSTPEEYNDVVDYNTLQEGVGISLGAIWGEGKMVQGGVITFKDENSNSRWGKLIDAFDNSKAIVLTSTGEVEIDIASLRFPSKLTKEQERIKDGVFPKEMIQQNFELSADFMKEKGIIPPPDKPARTFKEKAVVREKSIANKIFDIVGLSATTKGSLPILGTIAVKGNRIMATDLETAIVYTADKEIGNLAIPLTTLKGKYIEDLVIDEKNKKVKIGPLEAPGMDLADFPVIPEIKGDPVAKIYASGFIGVSESLKDVTPKTAPNEEITGVYLKGEGDTLEMVTTDAVRLYRFILTADIKKKFEVIIPGASLTQLVKLMKQTGEESVDLVINDEKNQARIDVGSFSFTTKLIDAEYPKYQEIIPKTTTGNFVIDREQFLSILKQVPKSRLNDVSLELKLKEGKIRIHKEDEAEGISFSQEISARPLEKEIQIKPDEDLYLVMKMRNDKDPNAIDFNISFLVDYLKRSRASEVEVLNLGKTDVPVLLRDYNLTVGSIVRDAGESYEVQEIKARMSKIKSPLSREDQFKMNDLMQELEGKMTEKEKDEFFRLTTFPQYLRGTMDYQLETLRQLKKAPIFRNSKIRLQLKKVGRFYNDKLTDISAYDVADIFSELKKEAREKTFILNLTKDNQIINTAFISGGTIDAALVSPIEIIKSALLSKADKFYFIHNHPTGDPTPSEADITVVARIKEALVGTGIEYAGGVVINHTTFGWMRPDGGGEVLSYTPRVKPGKEISAVDLELIEQEADLGYIHQPKNAALLFSESVDKRLPTIMAIYLGSRVNIQGVEVIGNSYKKMMSLRKKLSQGLSRYNSNGVVLVSNIKRGVFVDEQIWFLDGYLKILGLKLIDAISVRRDGTYESYSALGLLKRADREAYETLGESPASYSEFSDEEQAVLNAIMNGQSVPIELGDAVKSLQEKGIIKTKLERREGRPRRERAPKEPKAPREPLKPGERISLRGITLSRLRDETQKRPYILSYKTGEKSVVKTFDNVNEARDRFDMMTSIRSKGAMRRGELPKGLQPTDDQKKMAHWLAETKHISPTQYKRLMKIYIKVDSLLKATPEEASKFIDMLKALKPRFGGKITIPKTTALVTQEEAEAKFKNITAGWLLDIFRSPANVFKKMGVWRQAEQVFQGMQMKRDFVEKWSSIISRWQGELGIGITSNLFFKRGKFIDQSRRLFQAVNNPDINVQLDEKEALIVERAQMLANDIADMVDESRAEIGLGPMSRRENYITNLLTEESHFLLRNTKQSPEELYALLSERMPVSVFDRLLLERKGGLPIKQDFWQALKAMVKVHGKYIFINPPIHRFERFMKYWGDKLPFLSRKYITSTINRFLGRPTIIDKFLKGLDEAITMNISRIPGLSKKVEIEWQNGMTEVFDMPRFVLRPTSNVFRTMKSLRYIYDLLLSFSFYTINLTQFWLNTVPKLRGNIAETYGSAFYGWTKMWLDFFRPSMWQYWRERGVLTEVDQVIDQEFGKGKNSILNLFAKLSEFNNRVAAALSVEKNIELLRKSGKYERYYKELAERFGDEAQAYAKHISDMTQFRYGIEEKPIAFANPVMDLYYQYNTFALKQIEYTVDLIKNLEAGHLLSDLKKAHKEGKMGEFIANLTQGQRGDIIRFLINTYLLSLILGAGYVFDAVFKGIVPNQVEGFWNVLKGLWQGDKDLRARGFRQILMPPSGDLIEKVADYGLVATVRNAKVMKQLDLIRIAIVGEGEIKTIGGEVSEKITGKVAAERIFKSYREETALNNRKGWNMYFDLSQKYNQIREKSIGLIEDNKAAEARELVKGYNQEAKDTIQKMEDLEITDIRLKDNIKKSKKSKVVSPDDFRAWVQEVRKYKKTEEYKSV